MPPLNLVPHLNPYEPPPSYDDVVGSGETPPPAYGRSDSGLATDAGGIHDEADPLSHGDPRYVDFPAQALYDRSVADWMLPQGRPRTSLEQAQAWYDHSVAERDIQTSDDGVARLQALAVIAWLSPASGNSRLNGLLRQDLLDMMVRWTASSRRGRGGGALRAESMVVQYVRLLASLVGRQDIDPGFALDALRRTDRLDQPPLLLALASASATSSNVATALCDLLHACHAARRSHPSFEKTLVADLLATRDRRGLERGDKYDTFYGRVFGDGRTDTRSRPGAAIVGYRLGRLGLLPSDEAVSRTHSPTRAGKWLKAQKAGNSWGRGRSLDPRAAWQPQSQAARLYHRTFLENAWRSRHPSATVQAFAAITRSPSPSPSAPAR